MNLFLKSLLSFIFFLVAQCAVAQSIFFAGEAGTGLAYVSQKKASGHNRAPISGANASVSLLVPFSKKVCLETGLEYTRKGYKSDIPIENVDYPSYHMYYIATEKRNYLNIPLAVSGQVWRKSKHQMFVGAGMNFGFLLSAKTEGWFDAYSGAVQIQHQSITFSERIGLMQSNDENGRQKIDLYLFSAGVKFQVRYVYNDRYTVRLFQELNIGDAVASGDVYNAGLTQHYTGISVGVIFPKFKN